MRPHRPNVEYDGRELVDSHGPHDPQRIILHDTESHDLKGIADLAGIAKFFQSQNLGYGSHLCIDEEGLTGRYVDDGEIAWHCGGRNTGSLGIEQIGFASFTRAECIDEEGLTGRYVDDGEIAASFTRAEWMKRPKQLEKVARWIAWWSLTHAIPICHDVNHGVSTHADQSRAFHTTDHTDPGTGYPLDWVLHRASVLKKKGW